MNWFASLPIWVSLPVFVGGFVVVSCLIVLALRPVVRRIVDDVEQWDRVLGHVIGTFGVFFGILLALVAVSVYENYADTREAALHEAGQITALYRGTTGLPEEVAEPIEATIKEYLQAVIEEDWPDQRRGELPDGSLRLVNQIEEGIHGIEPEGLRRLAEFQQLLATFDDVVETRRVRIDATTLELPPVLDLHLGGCRGERRAHRPHHREESTTAPGLGGDAGVVHRTCHVHHGGHGPAVSGRAGGQSGSVRAGYRPDRTDGERT